MSECIECGKELNGRCDKKFCDDGCRNSHNNRIHREGSQEARRINRILEKNRKILESITISGRRSCSRFTLLERGFNFAYQTSSEIKKGGKVVIHCYDYSYSISSKNIVYVAIKNINQTKK